MFGVLTPHTQLSNHSQNHSESLRGLQNEIDLRPQAITDGGTTEGHFNNLKMVPNPPLLEEWRQRLFDVDETITLTEDEYVHYPQWKSRRWRRSIPEANSKRVSDSRPIFRT